MHEIIHDFICMGTPVINIADNMQMIHSQPFNQSRQRINKRTGTPRFQNRVEDFGMIDMTVFIFIRLGMKQFIDDEPENRWHRLTYLGTGILGRKQFRQTNQMMERLTGPFVRYQLFAVHKIQFFFWIINECQQVIPFFLTHGIGKEHFHFFPDNTGTIIQYMIKRFIFTMEVAHEMFRSLWQIHDSLQIDDFCKRRFLGRVFFSQEFQIFDIFIGISSIIFHLSYLPILRPCRS